MLIIIIKNNKGTQIEIIKGNFSLFPNTIKKLFI